MQHLEGGDIHIDHLFLDQDPHPTFAPYLIRAPEKHYADEECKMRLYHDMHTGDWWWSTQVSTQMIADLTI